MAANKLLKISTSKRQLLIKMLSTENFYLTARNLINNGARDYFNFNLISFKHNFIADLDE